MIDLPQDIDGLDFTTLKTLVLKVLEENAELRHEVADLRSENRRLKGLKGPPDIKPSGMDKKTQARTKAKAGRKANKARRGAKRDQITIDEERVIKAKVPPGSRFKGYEAFLVQDLVCRPHTILWRRERWQTVDGKTIVAPLPSGLRGHFGPELQRFILALYHGAQTTVERLTTVLRDMGIAISKRQVMRMLNKGQDAFISEADAVLRAGLVSASWISVDDTGARHQARNGFTTQIGNETFTWFKTTLSKSRLNFLKCLRSGLTDYIVNDRALAYMKDHGLSDVNRILLKNDTTHCFPDEPTWLTHLEKYCFKPNKSPTCPVRIATEAALIGVITENGLLQDTVIISDGAGQFKIGRRALCWVHMERQIHTLDTVLTWQRIAKETIQDKIWSLYADLKTYRNAPSDAKAQELGRRFDAIFTGKTEFAALDRLLKRIHAKKAEYLMVLKQPDLPLHTNGSENDIRALVTRRKLSGGTQSQDGKQARDCFLGLMKTCQKLNIPFWDYLGNRLKTSNAISVPYLPDLVAARC